MLVLLVGRDALGLDRSSATFYRWRSFVDAGIRLVCVISARKRMNLDDGDLRVISSGGRNVFVRLFRTLSLIIQEGKHVDLISVQDPFELGIIAYIVAMIYRKPLEVQDHGGFFDGEDPGEPFWWLRRHMAMFLLRKTQLIRTVSPGSLERLCRLGFGNKVVFIPIAAHERYEHVKRTPEKYHIITIGRLIPIKRHDLLIHAFSIFAKDKPEARLSILGDGPEKERLQRLIVDLNLSNRVSLLGNTDPLIWLKKADCFVMPSRHEGWGVAAVEAASVGVPVVMTNTGCAQWLVSHKRALVVDVDCSPRQLADMIDRACSEPFSDHSFLQLPQIPSQILAWKQMIQN